MVTFTKKSMVERCLIAASLAALVCHPSSTIKCFKPKPRSRSPQKQKPEDPSASPPKGSKRHGVVIGKEVPSNPKEKSCPKAASSSSSASKSRKTTKTKAEKPINLVSELVGGDPSIGVVESIIRSGWVGEVGLRIEKVLRVHHSLDVLHGFEEYRKMVKSKYEKDRIRKRVERLVVDGNELLQFHGAAITCSLGINGFSTICKKKCCQVCRIIASGFDTGDRTISFVHDSWKAHEKAAKECAGKGECARKAIVVCRVIAGRIAHYHVHGLMDEEEGEFDSAMEWGEQFSEPKRLVVLNSEAVLPCFVIIYNVKNKNLLHD